MKKEMRRCLSGQRLHLKREEKKPYQMNRFPKDIFKLNVSKVTCTMAIACSAHV